MSSANIPEDLLLIMQSYVDPISEVSTSSKVVGELANVLDSQANEDELWEEGEVEATIRVESDDEDVTEGLDSTDAPEAVPTAVELPNNNDSSSDSDSDSGSSSSSIRVTRYPTSSKPKQTVLMKLTDSDADDETEAGLTALAHYSGTKNEIIALDVEVPEITEVPVDDVLESVGEVMSIIDSVVVVKGHTTGVYRALDTDSLLVFEDRKVLGKVFETFGAVKEPLYSVRFPSSAVIDKNNIWIGRTVLHVPTRSNFVFTEAIARIKGSDASNIHDEEVADDQMEFSDDEAEAQWRRTRKEAKRDQASSSYNHDPQATTSQQPKIDKEPKLVYPTGDDGDVPYSTLPYDDVPDPRPAPAAYDPYSDHEEEQKPLPSTLPPRPQPSSRGAKPRGRGRGGSNQNSDQNRRERRNTAGSSERGRPNRGRGRGRGGRQNQHQQYAQNNHEVLPGQHYGEGFDSTRQYFPGSYTQDEGYNPVNANSGFFDSDPTGGTMPHINPRFFSGDMSGGDMNYGMQWGDMNGSMPGYGYEQPGFGYSGYGQADQMGYNNQGYGWPPNGQNDYSRGPSGRQ